MPIELSFTQPYGCISSFPSITLPSFTLITGLNGSGKTHLMRAILAGHVKANGIEFGSGEARFFDWNSFTFQDKQASSSAQLIHDKEGIKKSLQSKVHKYSVMIFEAAQQYGIPTESMTSAKSIASLSLEDIAGLIDVNSQAERAYNAIQNLVRQASNEMLESLHGNASLRQQFEELAALKGGHLAAVYDEESFFDGALMGWGNVAIFQQSFARLFITYRDLLLYNRVKKLAYQDGDKSVSYLTNEEFEQRYNKPPWDMVNDVLSTSEMDFRVEPPNLFEFGSYSATLRKKSTNTRVQFNELSSGEKVLMSLANCLYYASDQRQILAFPKLLLLDEIDAPLHPSMSKSLLNTLIKSIVAEHGVSVIASTHSPSTVALAPDESLYVMREDSPGVHKVSKSEALSVLLAGVPTISIDYSGRRQVFVESENDARVYDQLFQVARRYIQSERSLSFVSAGKRTPKGDLNSGCDQVKRIVSELEKSGNKSVLGLIDWDGKNNSSNRVKVLAPKRRDGLENCLFDPMIVACLIAREAKDRRRCIGLLSNSGANDLKHLSPLELQEVVDKVQALVIGQESGRTEPRIDVRYAGGLSLKIRRCYLELDDHKLEKHLLESVPALNKFKRASGLLIHTAENLIPDFPEFIPSDVLDTFKTLLSVDP